MNKISESSSVQAAVEDLSFFNDLSPDGWSYNVFVPCVIIVLLDNSAVFLAVVQEFCRISIQFIQNGSNSRLFEAAASGARIVYVKCGIVWNLMIIFVCREIGS
jgi:hypothetical protein